MYVLILNIILFSVPTFVNLPEDTLIKIADVLEEVIKAFIQGYLNKKF